MLDARLASLLAGLAIFVLLAPSGPVRAQTTQGELSVLVDRLEQVERDLTDLQRDIYLRGGAPEGRSMAEPASADPSLLRLSERVDEIDLEVRRLTGEVEELGYKIGQLTARLDRLEGGAPQPQANSSPTPGTPVSGNSAEQPGPAPGPTILGQVPADSVPSPQARGSAEDQYETALGYLRQQDYPRAEAAFRQFVQEHGETELAGPAMFWLGETYYIQDKFIEAAQTFLDALKKYPNNPKAPDSMLKLGMSLGKLGDAKQSCLAFRDLPKKYPNASQTILQRARVEAERAGCK